MFWGSHGPWAAPCSLREGEDVRGGVSARVLRGPGPSGELRLLGFFPTGPPPTSPLISFLLRPQPPELLCCVTPAGLLTSLASHFYLLESGVEMTRRRVWDDPYHHHPSGRRSIRSSCPHAKVFWASGCVRLSAGDGGGVGYKAPSQPSGSQMVWWRGWAGRDREN